MRSLIVHEWIEKHGGAEKVVDSMAQVLPGSDIFCLWDDDHTRYPRHKVTESWLAHSPVRDRKAFALPLMSRMWRNVDLRGYDRLVVSSHCYAHHVGSDHGHRDVPTYVYVHSPARYLWAPEYDARGQGPLVRRAAGPFKRLDRRHAGGASYVANSTFIRDRIRNAWGIDSRVIYPPVDVRRLQRAVPWAETVRGEELELLESLPDEFLLAASRLVKPKGADLAMKFAEKAGMPIVVAGRGPEGERLEAMAKTMSVPVYFAIWPTNEMLYALFQRAQAYVFPSIEDFGIMPVEAIALGTPVICNVIGGSLESSAVTGGGVSFPFHDKNWPDPRIAIREALELDMATAAKKAEFFADDSFREQITEWIGGH